MLFTRCPDCQTSFRITVSALTKADGQVRCGRCDAVFSASDDLKELKLPTDTQPEGPSGKVITEWAMPRPSDSDSFVILDNKDDEVAAEAANEAAEEPADEPADEPTDETPVEEEDAVIATDTVTEPAHESETERDEWATFFARARESASGAEVSGEETGVLAAKLEAELEAELEEGLKDEDDPEESGDDATDSPDDVESADENDLTAEQIDVTLSSDLDLESRLAMIEPEPEQPPRRSGWWVAGAVFLVLALAAQATHYFRDELADNALIGPLLQSIYAGIGQPVTPEWDLAQYEILDWIATASADNRGEDMLNISARIRNNGPRAQPYPSIRLALTDRWEQTVGSRIFSPEEYLPDEHLASGLMAASLMAPALLNVADRSDDAYGFELDVCISEATGNIACMSDSIFE